VTVRLAFAVIAIAFLAAAGIAVWEARQLSEDQTRRAEMVQDLKQLRSRLRAAEASRSTQEEQKQEPAGPGSEATPRRTLKSDAKALADRDAQIAQLRAELTAAKGQLSRVEEKVSAFDEERRQSIATANERFSTAQADWQAHLNEVSRQLQSAQAEAKSSRDRLAELEKSTAQLKEDAKLVSGRTAENARLLETLQDLNRRRDGFLTSVIRRYRDVTSQFRAMSGMLDGSHDQQPNAFAGTALSRIQSTIASAEDDLRQLNELNAQARQVERKLTANATK
jgi:chromosome segregation ATPase